MTYTTEQLQNARIVMDVADSRAADLGVSQGDLENLCLITALAESSLINVNHGDSAGPDSRGLYQQRNSWGTLAQRMDPAQSTQLFINAVQNVPGYRLLIVSSKPMLAQAVQRSQYSSGSNYLKEIPAAGEIQRLIKGGAGYKSYTINGITMQDPVWRKYLNSDGTYKGFPPANGKTPEERARQLRGMQLASIPGLRQPDGTYVSLTPALSDLDKGWATATHYSKPATNAHRKEDHLSTITFTGGKVSAYINESWHVTSGSTSGDDSAGAQPGLGPLNTLFGTFDFQHFLWIVAGGMVILAGVLILAKNQLPGGVKLPAGVKL